ncbi:hypothetical protein [Novipirellula aureliae]|nr:hypothetical protein [Novipirellula aureliae]
MPQLIDRRYVLFVGRQRAAELTWEKTMGQTVEVYRGLQGAS